MEGGVKMDKIFKKINIYIFIILIASVIASFIYFKTDVTIIADFIVAYAGFALTSLGFVFVVVQITTLAEQVQNEKDRHNKDSEFKNFLEATKMLTSSKNKKNTEAQISAMYLLYDFAKNYPENNLEKVMKILNRYVTPIYKNSRIITNFKITSSDRKPITDRELINSWRETGSSEQQIASIALELNKKLFVYALQHNDEVDNINLSGIVIFDLDIEVDFEKKYKIFSKKYQLSEIINSSEEMIFLFCNFKPQKFFFGKKKKEIAFSTKKLFFSNKSTAGRMNISRSKFINCDLSGCNFSYSNLWGVIFEECTLVDTKFKKAECEAVQFLGKTKIKLDQIKRMLFIDKDKYPKEIPYRIIQYGIIYSESIEGDAVNKNCFFRDKVEYNKFKNGQN